MCGCWRSTGARAGTGPPSYDGLTAPGCLFDCKSDMETRVLPEPDRFATCPDDGKILEYYRGVFEAVFVSLHPFIKPFPASRTLFESPTLPDRATVAAHCEAVPWSAIMQLTGLPSLSAVDIGLRTGIHALNKGFAREDYARTLQGLEKSEGIICPAEGYFSDMSHDAMLKSIRSLGHRPARPGQHPDETAYWTLSATRYGPPFHFGTSTPFSSSHRHIALSPRNAGSRIAGNSMSCKGGWANMAKLLRR